METEEKQLESTVGEMRKRRELMADERRYIIYYTFGEAEIASQQTEVPDNV